MPIPSLTKIGGDAGGFTITETGGVSKSLPDALKEKVPGTDHLGGLIDIGDTFETLTTGAGLDLRASETTLASNATVDLGAVTTFKAAITGTTPITSFGSTPNVRRWLRFTGVVSVVLPGGFSVVTQAGATALVASDETGFYRVYTYQRPDGRPVSYETGSFTPVPRFFGGNGSFEPTITTATGVYRRISELVYFVLNLTFTPNNGYSGTSGGFEIGGLPWPSSVGAYLQGPHLTRRDNINVAGLLLPSLVGSGIRFIVPNANGLGTIIGSSAIPAGANITLALSGFYLAAA